MSYTNPLIYEDRKLYTAPDPFILHYRGRYYSYSSGSRGVGLSMSSDLIHWDRLASPYREEGRKNYWAPSVLYINGIFYMYLSNMPENEKDTHTEVLRVVRSNSPTGPFKFVSELFNTFSIDSQVIRLQDGKLVLFYADNQVAGLNESFGGTSVMYDALTTPTKRYGQPTSAIVPTNHDELFAANRFGDGRNWYTVEGPTYFTHHGYSYLTYSGNSYLNKNYFIGWSKAKGVPSNWEGLAHLHWDKNMTGNHVTALIKSGNGITGTGHNSIVNAPNDIDPWIIYHGRATEKLTHDNTSQLENDSEDRVMCADPLYYNGDNLFTPAPSKSNPFDPAPPELALNTQQSLKNWTVDGHVSSQADKDGNYFSTTGDSSIKIISKISDLDSYNFDFWIRVHTSPLGERFGIVLSYMNTDNWAELVIDLGRQKFYLDSHEKGIKVIQDLPLLLSEAGEDQLAWSQWHHLVVVKRNRTFTLCIDGMMATRGQIKIPGARVGLCSNHTKVDLSSIALTEHIDLWGDSLRDIVNEFSATRNLAIAQDHNNWCVKPLKDEAHFSIVTDTSNLAVSLTIKPLMSGSKQEFSLDCGPLHLRIHEDVIEGSSSKENHAAQKFNLQDGLTMILKQKGRTIQLATSAGGEPLLARGNGQTIACSMSGFSISAYERTGRLRRGGVQ